MLPNQFQELLEELLKKNSRGACSPQEERLIIDWYNNIGKSENIPLSKEAKIIIEEKLWSAINPNPSQNIKWRSLLKVAAVITIPLLACLGFYLNRQSLAPLIVPTQEEALASKHPVTRVFNESITSREITLADGSLVILQPKSEIRFDKDFTNEIRKVHLKGEAFFKVKRDPLRPFMVYANEVVTRVLGTSFNIKAYENEQEITVAVKTGKVSVYANNELNSGKNNLFESQEVILTPNQQVVYNRVREVVSKKLVEKPEIILPNSDLFSMQFDNAEVTEIFQVLEENYGIQIRYDENIMHACRLTTSMSDEGLYERIEVICKAIGASYSVSDAVITIKSNGC